MLRIEDTDQARKMEGAEAVIEESIKWLRIVWDEKIVQSANLDEYRKKAEELVKDGKAREDNDAIRFIIPKDGTVSWVDAVGNKKIEFKKSELEDFIILKSDGYPTYHLANVIDDHAEGITHVIRGEDWIPSTPKHILLYEAFGWGDSMPVFVHVPNIFGPDGKKLSKRRGAKSVLDFRKEGILPEALLNYLMLLGWSPKNDKEILSINEIEKEFKLENLNVSPAIFDEKKLFWMNGEYIRNSSDEEIKNKLLEFDPEVTKIQDFEKYIPAAKTRMKTLAEFVDLVKNEDNTTLSDNQKKLAQILIDKFSDLSSWEAPEIADVTFKARDEAGVSTKDIFVVLTGKSSGLPFDQKLQIQGKEETLKWLNKISA